MKIQGPTATPYTPPAREVAPTRTPVTRGDLRAAIARALEKVHGKKPSPAMVDTLTAQASLETASGERMYNFNFGGIKGTSPSGATAVLRTHEVIGGKDVVIRDGFRAYASLDEGALDYVKTLEQRFAGATEPASRGDAAGFAHALKKAGYYTASEADYSAALGRLMGKSDAGVPGATTGEPAVASRAAMPLSSEGLSRALGALDVLGADRFAVLASNAAPSHHAKDGEEEDF